SLELSKNFVGLLNIEAHAVIANEEDSLSVLSLLANLYQSASSRSGELDSVRKKIPKRLSKQGAVAFNCGERSNLPANFAPARFSLDFANHLSPKEVEINRFAPNLLFAESGKVQQGVNQLAHMTCTIPDLVQALLMIRREVIRSTLQEDLRKPINLAQRRPQIMRHRITKRVQFLVTDRQLRYPGIQLRVELA